MVNCLRLTMFACIAVVGLLPYGTKTQSDCTDIDPINSIDIFLLGTQLVVVWQEPENMATCGFENVIHTVTYTGFESIEEVETSEYYAYFAYAPYRCVPSVITITASNGDVSTSVTVDYYTETSQVEDLTINQDTDGILVASWSEPEDAEYCNFIYLVTYEDEISNTATIETSDLQATLDSVTLSSCITATISVTPINGKYTGVTSSAESRGDINPVRNYVLTEIDTEIIATFSPPVGIEFCDVTYEVKGSQGDCYQKVISVAAFDGSMYGPWVSDAVEEAIGGLSNLSASIGGNYVEISWTAPSDAEACGITYQIVYGDETYTSTESSYTLSDVTVEACVETTISVSAISSTGLVGIASEVQIQKDLPGIGGLSVSTVGNTIHASWVAPPNSSYCILSYLLEYTNENGTHLYVTTDYEYSFEYTFSCIDISLSVTPYSEDGSYGGKTTVTLPAAC